MAKSSVERSHYVVAIGEYKRVSGKLKHEGKIAARRAAKSLGNIPVKNSVILGLDTPRHRRSAEIIAKGLKNAQVHLNEGQPQELWPEPRVDTKQMTEIFRDHLEGSPADGVTAILAATPELIASVLDQDPGSVSPGTVYSFDPKNGLAPVKPRP